MELRATMELRVGRDKSTGKKGTPYIVRDKDPTVIHLPARGQWYYRTRQAVLLWGHAVLPLAAKRYYRMVMRYSRTGPRYCRLTAEHGTTAEGKRYYRGRRGCKKLHPPLLP